MDHLDKKVMYRFNPSCCIFEYVIDISYINIMGDKGKGEKMMVELNIIEFGW